MSELPTSARPLRTAVACIGPFPSLSDAAPDDVTVNEITVDSREVGPGSLFVALAGSDVDGHGFVEEAVARGAVAVLVDRDVTELPVPVLRVADTRRALAELAATWYGNPGEEITLVGITGSLGKTSILTLLEAILGEAGLHVGAIGSEIVGIRLEDQVNLETGHTTPDPLTLQRGLRRVVDEGADVVCMEVTSHGLDQERVHGLRFGAGIFSNLVRLEHQDYHGTFEEYVRTKLRFCDHLRADTALTYGIDSPLLGEALAECEIPLVSCGFDERADIGIVGLRSGAHGTTFSLEVRAPLPRHDGSTLAPTRVPLELRLLGRPYVLNAALAATEALRLGVDVPSVQRALAVFPPTARRMQLTTIGDCRVLDDAAVHPESLEAVFDVIGQLDVRRLHVVVAIRGRRGARINGEVAALLARCYQARPFDTLIVTDSADAVSDLDRVQPEEREAYLDALRQHDVAFEHREGLEEAVAEASSRVGPDDILVLLGAQGMHPGADLMRKQHGIPVA